MPRVRVISACDRCKLRKIKCDGNQPCSHCQRRNNGTCRYSPTNRLRVEARPQTQAPYVGVIDLKADGKLDAPGSALLAAPQTDSHADDEDTDVPLQARLLQDEQGKLSFIGDCAPLSFLQTVRHLVVSCVDQNAFNNQLGRDPMLEQTDPWDSTETRQYRPSLPKEMVEIATMSFLAVTSGFIDPIDAQDLRSLVGTWAAVEPKSSDITSAICYLVLAIGLQCVDETLASQCFHIARNMALAHLTGNTSPATAQAFLLVSIYMLRACQANGAFLYFGLAARASYSTGMHRTQVNARFGREAQQSRERLYKSLKTFDTFISICLGRPPALYDLDCTVPYKQSTVDVATETDCLDDTLQIFLIAETVVVEVYSRRKISLQLTTKISQQLKEWASQRLPRLLGIVANSSAATDLPMIIGACQALSTYYYTIMLLTKPFLMYEVYRKLAELRDQQSAKQTQPRSSNKGRTKLAESCIDAACTLVDLVQRLQASGAMPHKMPLVVPWLLTAALVLGVSLLGGFGRVLEKYLGDAITALEYFAKHDAQALQYAYIAKSLLSTALECLQRNELIERKAKGRHSMDMFGLIPSPFQQQQETRAAGVEPSQSTSHVHQNASPNVTFADAPASSMQVASDASTGAAASVWDEVDFAAFGEGLEGVSDDIFGDLNLFFVFEANAESNIADIT